MALGRSAPMLTSASPGRGGGDGAGAGRAQPATGSSTTIANSAAPTVVELSLARSAPRSSGSERSAEFGSVNTVRCPHARARGGVDSSALGGRPTCTGRLGGAAAAGRRRHFFFAELLLAASGAFVFGVCRARGECEKHAPNQQQLAHWPPCPGSIGVNFRLIDGGPFSQLRNGRQTQPHVML